MKRIDNHLGMQYIIQDLYSKGFSVEIVPGIKKYDLIINSKKIQLKTSNFVPIKKKNHGKTYDYEGFIFQINKKHTWDKYNKCDILMCVGFNKDNSKEYYIIPIKEILNRTSNIHLIRTRDGKERKKNNFMKYLDKFEYLTN